MLTVRIVRQRRRRTGNTVYGYSTYGPNLPFWQRSRWYLWPPGYKLMPMRHPERRLGRSTWEFPLAPGFSLQIGQEGD